MASVYRRKCNRTSNSKKVKRQSRYWYVKYRDASGIEHRVRGYTDKEATKQMAARLEREAALAGRREWWTDTKSTANGPYWSTWRTSG